MSELLLSAAPKGLLYLMISLPTNATLTLLHSQLQLFIIFFSMSDFEITLYHSLSQNMRLMLADNTVVTYNGGQTNYFIPYKDYLGHVGALSIIHHCDILLHILCVDTIKYSIIPVRTG